MNGQVLKSRRQLRAIAVTAVLVTGLCTQGQATAQGQIGFSGAVQGIEAIVRLPASSFSLVEAQGRVFLVSRTGQYVVTDPNLRDMWNGLQIASVEEAHASFSIPLERMNLGDDDLNGVLIGKAVQGGPKPVTLFLDPASPETRKIMPAVHKFSYRYPFRLVFVPARPERNGATQALLCSPEAAKAFVEQGVVPTHTPRERCGADAARKNILMVQVLGIDSLPFLLASNGRVSPGMPEDLDKFLLKNVELVQ